MILALGADIGKGESVIFDNETVTINAPRTWAIMGVGKVRNIIATT
jgi:hypothetical protein